jgi:uncharacterized Zn-finger protein
MNAPLQGPVALAQNVGTQDDVNVKGIIFESPVSAANSFRAGGTFTRETSIDDHKGLPLQKTASATPRAVLPQLKYLNCNAFALPSMLATSDTSSSAAFGFGECVLLSSDNSACTHETLEPYPDLAERIDFSVSHTSVPRCQPEPKSSTSTYWSTVLMTSENTLPRPSIISGNLRHQLSLRPALGIMKPSLPAPRVSKQLLSLQAAKAEVRDIAEDAQVPKSSQSDTEAPIHACESGDQDEQTTVKSHTCRKCKSGFETRAALTEHSKDCHSRKAGRTFLCKHCGATFHKNSNLVKHISLVELKLRPYKCTLCDAKFGQKSNLSSHVRVTHQGERRYACSEPNCDRRFGQNSGLRAHIRTVHLGARDFVCECERRFGSRGDLNRHIRSAHQKLLPFPCTTCGKAFSRKSVLQRHRATVHAEQL